MNTMADCIRAEIRTKFVGHAHVALSNLLYTSAREKSGRGVARLTSVFESDCDRADLSHSVPAIIDIEVLQEALTISGLNLLAEEPTRLLRLPAGVKLRCLHGLQRLLAAEQALPPHDQWWPVALYASCETNGSCSASADCIQHYQMRPYTCSLNSLTTPKSTLMETFSCITEHILI